jgi:mannosyltransferase OCH1-like enzyme
MPAVPKILHFFIAAKDQTASVAGTIKQWADKNLGWQIFVWCDAATLGANHVVASAKATNVEIKTVDPNAATGAGVGAGPASPAVRYQTLAKYGGCYLDTDVQPGDPLPALSVDNGEVLIARATPSRPDEIDALACVPGPEVEHIASFLNQNLCQFSEAAITQHSKALPNQYVRPGNC